MRKPFKDSDDGIQQDDLVLFSPVVNEDTDCLPIRDLEQVVESVELVINDEESISTIKPSSGLST